MAATTAAAEASAEPAVATAEEEDVSFAAVVDRMAVPKGEDRESEDYGEDEDEEYEIPTTVVQEARPAAIRFGEDLLGRQRAAEEEAAKAKAVPKKRRSRGFEEEEDDMDDIEYSGRIH